MKKKLFAAVALTMAAVTLVVCSVWATVAYLTASSGVSNVFTVGNVSITMYETKVNSDGVPVTPAAKVDTNSYHLVPDKTYVKDPTIKITSLLEEDEMYLYVKSSNQIRKAEAGNQPGADENTPKSMRQQMIDNGWVEFVRSGDGVEVVWVYGTRDSATGVITPTAVNPTTVQTRSGGATGEPGEFRLCEEFTIDAKADVSLYGAASVSFTAFAIQTSGLETVQEAWEGIKQSYPYDCGIVNPVNPYNNSTTNPYDPVAGVEGPVPIA